MSTWVEQRPQESEQETADRSPATRPRRLNPSTDFSGRAETDALDRG